MLPHVSVVILRNSLLSSLGAKEDQNDIKENISFMLNFRNGKQVCRKMYIDLEGKKSL